MLLIESVSGAIGVIQNLSLLRGLNTVRHLRRNFVANLWTELTVRGGYVM
jgi:hypothetical protein